ncbi:hypothetical protein GEMRC1_003213 [Eukaryota sp. GEM-RC1]
MFNILVLLTLLYHGVFCNSLVTSTVTPTTYQLTSSPKYSGYYFLNKLHLTEPCTTFHPTEPLHNSSFDPCLFNVQFVDGSVVAGHLSFFTPTTPNILPFQPSDPFIFSLANLDLLSIPTDSLTGILGIGSPSLDPCVDGCYGSSVLPLLLNHSSSLLAFCFGRSIGELMIGDVNFELVASPFDFVRLLDQSGFVAEMKDVLISKKRFLTYDGQFKLIFDTGARDMLLTRDVFEELHQFFIKHYSHLIGISQSRSLFDGFCFEIHSRHVNSFPEITIVFDTFSLKIPPSNYLVTQIDNGILSHCLAIKPVDSLEYSSNTFIVGSLVLISYYVTVDLDHLRLGFALKADENCGVDDTFDCPMNCRGRGECYYGICICTYGWQGETCQELRITTYIQLALFLF